MTRWEADYEILSDVIHAWLGGIVGFYVFLLGWLLFAVFVALIGGCFVTHPVVSTLVVLGVMWFLAVRCTFAGVWAWVRFLLVLVLGLGLFVAGLTLAPYLTIAAAVGLVIWAVVQENRRMSAQAAAEESTRLEHAELTPQRQEAEGDDDGGTPGSLCEP